MDVPSIVKAGGSNIKWMIVEFDEYAGNIFDGLQHSYTYLTKMDWRKERYKNENSNKGHNLSCGLWLWPLGVAFGCVVGCRFHFRGINGTLIV